VRQLGMAREGWRPPTAGHARSLRACAGGTSNQNTPRRSAVIDHAFANVSTLLDMFVVVLAAVSFSVFVSNFFQGPIVITPLSPVITPFCHTILLNMVGLTR
jgi:hypothetical protein